MSQALKTSKQVQSYRSVEKFGIEHLSLSDSAPEALGYGQVRVKMHAVSLNYRDLMIIKGIYNPNVREPTGIIPLSDGTGEVVEVADGVTRFKVGDRVASLFFQKWVSGECDEQKAKSALAGIIDGVLTTDKVFHEDGLIAFPDHLSYEEGATLPCAALTAWHGLVVSGQVKSGETVLLQGTGGVSIFALQFAKMAGASVILTSSSDAKLETAKKMGADHLINYKQEPDWEKKVKQITNGRGVDHVIEVAGGANLVKSFQCVRIGGKLALIGALSGRAGEVNPLPIVMKNLRVQGIYVGSREMFEGMNRAIAAHKLRPVIDRVFPFEKTKEALTHMDNASHFGKVVIKVR
jgi:NADPH:quinone reductase-like Zn-dependent oxidoreductase